MPDRLPGSIERARAHHPENARSRGDASTTPRIPPSGQAANAAGAAFENASYPFVALFHGNRDAVLPFGLHTRGATFFELRAVSLYARQVAINCQAQHQINDYLLEMCAARYDQAQREAHRAAECVPTDLILTQLASQFVSRLAVQQCTQISRNGVERPFPPICVHCCVVALAVRPTPPGR